MRAKAMIDAKLAEGRTFTKPAYFPPEPEEEAPPAEEDESKDEAAAPPDAVSDLEARLNALRR